MSGSGTVSPVYDFKILYSKLVKNFRIIVIEKLDFIAKTMNAELICFDCGHYIHYYKSAKISKKIIEFVNKLEQ